MREIGFALSLVQAERLRTLLQRHRQKVVRVDHPHLQPVEDVDQHRFRSAVDDVVLDPVLDHVLEQKVAVITFHVMRHHTTAFVLATKQPPPEDLRHVFPLFVRDKLAYVLAFPVVRVCNDEVGDVHARLLHTFGVEEDVSIDG